MLRLFIFILQSLVIWSTTAKSQKKKILYSIVSSQLMGKTKPHMFLQKQKLDSSDKSSFRFFPLQTESQPLHPPTIISFSERTSVSSWHPCVSCGTPMDIEETAKRNVQLPFPAFMLSTGCK